MSVTKNEYIEKALLALVKSSEALSGSHPPLSPERTTYERGYRFALSQAMGIMRDVHEWKYDE